MPTRGRTRTARWAVTGVAAAAATGAIAVGNGLLGEVIKQAVGGSLVPVAAASLVVLVLAGVSLFVARKGNPSPEPEVSSTDVAVVVHLPVSGGPSDSPFKQAKREAERTFTASPVVIERELPSSQPERAKTLDQVYAAYQDEVTTRTGHENNVALFLVAKLPDAFHFGQKLAYGLRGTRLMQLEKASPDQQGQFFPAIRLDSRHHPALTPRERKRAEQFLQVDKVTWPENSQEKRIALVPLLTGGKDTRGEMERALAGGTSTKYDVSPDERCRAALIVSAKSRSLPQTREAFELAVRFIQDEWSDWGEQHADDPEKLLMPAAPNTVVAALGFMFARASMRVVEHTPAPTSKA